MLAKVRLKNAKRLLGQVALGKRKGALNPRSQLIEELNSGKVPSRFTIRHSRFAINPYKGSSPNLTTRLKKELSRLLKIRKEKLAAKESLTYRERKQIAELKLLLAEEIKKQNKPVKLP